jgi:hypothetical protein
MFADDTSAGGATGPFRRYPATPTEVLASADELTASAGSLDLLVHDVEVTHAPAESGVAGVLTGPMATAPTAVRANARRVLLATLCAGGAVRGWARAIDRFDRVVDRLNAEWDAAVATDFGVPRAELLARLRRRHADAETALDDAAHRAARRLDEGPTDGVLRRLFAAGLLPYLVARAFPRIRFEYGRLPYDLAAMDPSDLARKVIEGAIDVHGFRLPQSILDAIGAILADKTTDAVFEYGTGPDDLADLTKLLERIGDIDGVDAAFVDSLGGEGLLDVISRLASAHTGGLSDPNNAIVVGLMGALKRSTETATEQMTPAQQRELADELIDALRDDPGDGVLPEDRAEYVLVNARGTTLSYLLQDGCYETEFLDEVGGRLDSLEREEGLGYDHWIYFDHTTFQIASVLFDTNDVPNSDRDVMTSYMSALGNNGEAALDFFTADDQGPGSRADYYLKHRGWAHDRFDSLLAAVDAATTDPYDYTGRRDEAAGLMSSVVDYLAHRHQVFGDPDAQWVDEMGDSDELFAGDNLSDAAAVRMAHMLDRYLPAVDLALDDGMRLDESQAGDAATYESRGLDRFGIMPRFERGELAVVTEAALGSDNALATLTDAVRDYLHAQLDHGTRPDGTIRQEYVNADARLRGFLVHSTNGAEITEADAKDQGVLDSNSRKGAVLKLLSFTGGQAIRFPNPYSILAGGGLLVGSTLVSDVITDDPHWRDEAVDAANDEAQEGAVQSQASLTHLLYDRGVYDRHDLLDALDDHRHDDRPLPTRTQVRSWFADDYPSLKQIGDDPNDRTRLDNLLRYVLEPKGVDIESFGRSYDDAFQDVSIDGDGQRREP